MNEKSIKLITNCHLFLMIAMALFSLVAALVLMFARNIIPEADLAAIVQAGPVINVYGIVLILNFLSLACGIIYIQKGYTKAAANYYKAFIVFAVLSNVASLIAGVMYQGFDVAAIAKIVKIVLLLVLVLVKDLGEKKTWTIFGCIVVIDLAYDFLFKLTQEGILPAIALALVRLLCMGTIGLSIRGKYEDKKERGTK